MSTFGLGSALHTQSWYKNVRLPPLGLDQLGPKAVLADVLRTLEGQLQRRSLVSAGSFNPLWFLVETERNIFLWRHGLSIAQQDDFEFWVDIDTLIEKRRSQLANPNPANPFHNPNWDLLDCSITTQTNQTDEHSKAELRYLDSFSSTFSQIASHANALSHTASLLRAELQGHIHTRVLLPSCGRSTGQKESPAAG